VTLPNVSSESLTVPKTTVFGIAEGVSEPLLERVNAESQTSSNLPTKPRRKIKNEILYHKLLQEKLDHLS
jgi:hypothetical protein